jgi:hypothetical protein
MIQQRLFFLFYVLAIKMNLKFFKISSAFNFQWENKFHVPSIGNLKKTHISRDFNARNARTSLKMGRRRT